MNLPGCDLTRSFHTWGNRVSRFLDAGSAKISSGTWVPGGTTIMEQYVALDVSLREISVCVIDGKGAVVFEGKTAADPVGLAQLIRAKAP